MCIHNDGLPRSKRPPGGTGAWSLSLLLGVGLKGSDWHITWWQGPCWGSSLHTESSWSLLLITADTEDRTQGPANSHMTCYWLYVFKLQTLPYHSNVLSERSEKEERCECNSWLTEALHIPWLALHLRHSPHWGWWINSVNKPVQYMRCGMIHSQTWFTPELLYIILPQWTSVSYDCPESTHVVWFSIKRQGVSLNHSSPAKQSPISSLSSFFPFPFSQFTNQICILENTDPPPLSQSIQIFTFPLVQGHLWSV